MPEARSGRVGRSILAVLLGLVLVFVLSLGVDQVLHVLQVYPPWGAPMYDPGLNLLALSYRLVFNVSGSYLTARLAPHSPMRHALIGGGIGLVLSIAGIVASLNMNLGPVWYPVLLAASALPCAWFGGWLVQRRQVAG